ncbi:Dioxygenase [Candidatus Methylobacter favarea]|uniref:Dioxygenase n=1 Tax=Candidatus Methylobacter favarea TaxID=2707345 RepID=A0A8S0WSK0_9GAMM|nr:carotenoid oxygenase family protein [Candidatus Methylobacter favarea]CAA9892841.1 Dioxygenase [Candidatus Methylobacter favarea]
MNQPPYHLGFSTLRQETSLDNLPVRGTVPKWLNGSLVRTAPAMFEVGEQRFNHWFDGLAMLYRFTFASGRIAYANRYLHSRSYLEAVQKGGISRGEFATNPRRNLFERIVTCFRRKLTDNANVNVNQLANGIAAYTETPLPIRFDLETLSTLAYYSYGKEAKGQISTAHPHLDHVRGRHYNYLLEFGWMSKYRFIGIDMKTGRQSIVATVSTDLPAYTHSFGMTARYLVLTEFPLVVHPLRLRFSGEPFIRNYRWQPDRGVRFHVIDKDTGQVVRRVQGGPVFAFHHVNGFEHGDDVVIDIVTYPDAGLIDQLYLNRLRSAAPMSPVGKLTRFRIGPKGDAREETLPAPPMELPRMDYARRAGRPYRYLYAAGNEKYGNFFDKLVKSDLDRSVNSAWRETGCYPGEPVFVAAPGAANEDDGAVLSVVLDAGKSRSFLLILDAATFQEVARADLPHHIPFGFHGNYFAATSEP